MNDVPQSGVSFEDEPTLARAVAPIKTSTSLAGWLSKNSGGVFKTEKEASLVLLISAGLLLAASLFFIGKALNPIPKPSGEVDEIATPPTVQL